MASQTSPPNEAPGQAPAAEFAGPVAGRVAVAIQIHEDTAAVGAAIPAAGVIARAIGNVTRILVDRLGIGFDMPPGLAMDRLIGSEIGRPGMLNRERDATVTRHTRRNRERAQQGRPDDRTEKALASHFRPPDRNFSLLHLSHGLADYQQQSGANSLPEGEFPQGLQYCHGPTGASQKPPAPITALRVSSPQMPDLPLSRSHRGVFG